MPTLLDQRSQDLVAFPGIGAGLCSGHEPVQDVAGMGEGIEGPLSGAEVKHDEREGIDVHLFRLPFDGQLERQWTGIMENN